MVSAMDLFLPPPPLLHPCECWKVLVNTGVGVVVSHSLALSDSNAAAALFPQTNVPCEERIHYELVVQYLSSYVML